MRAFVMLEDVKLTLLLALSAVSPKPQPTESPHVTDSPTNLATPLDPSPADFSLNVSLGERAYPICISTDKWDQVASKILATLGDMTHALVIGDQAVTEKWSAPIVLALRKNARCDFFEVASGETSKSVACLAEIWEWMQTCGTDRKSVVIAIGGGVVGDLAGFAAASYARGIRLVQIPTTLLAQVDSSVGGKTGINLTAAKNMVGAFWQPSLVLIETQTLSTLPQRAYLSGLAEIIKYGVIEDAKFFAWLERNADALVAREPGAIRHAIATSCRIKADVVANDERETSGRRAILNYGHTFAHAIEATAGYGTFLHGEAVAIGMEMAAQLSFAMGLADKSLVQRQSALIQACSLPTRWPDANADAMIASMRSDKKVAHATMRFVLPDRIGHVELIACNDLPGIADAIARCK